MKKATDILELINNINMLRIQIAAETIQAYCHFDNQPFTLKESVKELQNFIELADTAVLLKYPIMQDVLYYGLLIRLSDDTLSNAAEKFKGTQFAKDCIWCIEKHQSIQDEMERNKLHKHHIEWLNGEEDYLFGNSLDDALLRNGYSLVSKSQISRWEVINNE